MRRAMVALCVDFTGPIRDTDLETYAAEQSTSAIIVPPPEAKYFIA
jgi:hypothetical protein